MGLKQRQRENALRRARGDEPTPGCSPGRSPKRWARYLSRVPPFNLGRIKNPLKYLSSHQRRRVVGEVDQ